MLHQQHLQDSEQSFYSRHRCCSRAEKGEEEKERSEDEEDQAAKKYGDETSPQVACENTFLCVDKVVVIEWKFACYYSYVKITLFTSGKKLDAHPPLLVTLSFFQSPPSTRS